MIKVTFDTNTFDKVARPDIYAKDPSQGDCVKVSRAVQDGRVSAFICDTMITLEGIKVDDRAKVFGSTTLVSNSSMAEGTSTIHIGLKMEQPLRTGLHPKQAERFVAALGGGFKLLGAPRIGMPRVESPDSNPYAVETDAELSERLDRYFNILVAIERRGLGSVQAKQLAERLAGKSAANTPWFKVLGMAHDIHETREVARAIAEWADADSIAAHYGYGNDLFCTQDEARPGHPSVLDFVNRAWLAATYNVRFADIRELAALL